MTEIDDRLLNMMDPIIKYYFDKTDLGKLKPLNPSQDNKKDRNKN